jgi:hypothetical protein
MNSERNALQAIKRILVSAPVTDLTVDIQQAIDIALGYHRYAELAERLRDLDEKVTDAMGVGPVEKRAQRGGDLAHDIQRTVKALNALTTELLTRVYVHLLAIPEDRATAIAKTNLFSEPKPKAEEV